MTLPQNTKLPISALAGIFSNTTATYKYYWFVAMMDIVVKERRTKMSFWEIVAGMVAELRSSQIYVDRKNSEKARSSAIDDL